MNWVDIVHETEGIKSIYGEHPPRLERIALHEVTLHRDGPRATLRFDLPELPGVLPSKWKRQGFNVVQVAIMFVNVFEVSIKKWSNESIVDLQITDRDGKIEAATQTGPIDLHIEAGTAAVNSISAYRNNVSNG